MIRHVRAIVCVTAVAACAPAATETAQPTGILQPAPPPADASAIPAGSDLVLRLDVPLGANRLTVGQTFTASVEEALIARNGDVVIPEGSTVTGLVTGVAQSADSRTPAALRLNFVRIGIGDANHPFSVEILRTGVPVTAVDPGAPGNATATGTMLGAIVDGELRTALIEGSLGAGAGTIISLGTGDVEPVLPEGTLLHIRTRDTIELR